MTQLKLTVPTRARPAVAHAWPPPLLPRKRPPPLLPRKRPPPLLPRQRPPPLLPVVPRQMPPRNRLSARITKRLAAKITRTVQMSSRSLPPALPERSRATHKNAESSTSHLLRVVPMTQLTRTVPTRARPAVANACPPRERLSAWITKRLAVRITRIVQMSSTSLPPALSEI